ncbi:MAG: hypothetical protein LQ351_007558 [Letrouitia transgressa]|nr:MAG: hypothetical protein LQ351_007558 [Letrouitia transgressa]
MQAQQSQQVLKRKWQQQQHSVQPRRENDRNTDFEKLSDGVQLVAAGSQVLNNGGGAVADGRDQATGDTAPDAGEQAANAFGEAGGTSGVFCASSTSAGVEGGGSGEGTDEDVEAVIEGVTTATSTYIIS